MSHRAAVLALLADGCFQSGTEIGRTLGISRAAVNKIVRWLVRRGVALECRRGQGYRLDQRFVPLVATRLAELWPDARSWTIEVLPEVDSTNRYLCRLSERGVDVHRRICFAESQSAGTGRHGRQWVATPYSNLMLSLAWRFEVAASCLGGLSLAVGVAVRSALADCGLASARLKWPNDLVCGSRKLGGVLIELRSEAESPVLAVCGVGLNVYMGPEGASRIDQDWTDMIRELGAPVDRHRLAAAVLGRLDEVFSGFAEHGFDRWRPLWEQFHRDAGAEVEVIGLGGHRVSGKALGADEHGGLRLCQAGGVITIYSGDVSLRREFID